VFAQTGRGGERDEPFGLRPVVAYWRHRQDEPPPRPRRTVLTRTALLAPGRTTTSPALTSPAKTTFSTDEDNTAREDRLRPHRKHDMYDMCTAGYECFRDDRLMPALRGLGRPLQVIEKRAAAGDREAGRCR
jgi:hypothetical protein